MLSLRNLLIVTIASTIFAKNYKNENTCKNQNNTINYQRFLPNETNSYVKFYSNSGLIGMLAVSGTVGKVNFRNTDDDFEDTRFVEVSRDLVVEVFSSENFRGETDVFRNCGEKKVAKYEVIGLLEDGESDIDSIRVSRCEYKDVYVNGLGEMKKAGILEINNQNVYSFVEFE